MSEENNPPADPPKEPEFKAPQSQEEFDRMVGQRLERERAKFGDYDDLKAKAAKFDEVEEKNKTELQKATERAAEAERKAALAERTALRTRIAAETGVPVEVLHGDDEDSIKAAAQKVIDWRDSNKKQPPSPKKLASGSGGEPKSGEKGKAAAALRSLRQG